MIARLTAVLYHRPAGCEYKGADIHIQKKTTDINKYGDFMCGNIWRYFSLGLCLAFSLTACSQSPDSNTLQVLSRVHFNTNVSNFEDSKLFYAQLGFETVSGFPDNNTLAMAQAVGISTPTSYDGAQGGAAGGYLLHGELIGLGLTGGVIDLIEFKIPRNDSPPYSTVNHLGMSRATMLTSNIAADYLHLKALGIAFLRPPISRKNGERFTIFTDPDGTFYELRSLPRSSTSASANAAGTYIQQLGPVTINVTNYDRSARWYEQLGYRFTKHIDPIESLEVSQAMGLQTPFEIKGGLFIHSYDGSQLEIVEWKTPKLLTPPYPIPINHLGIHRIALSTADIEGDVKKLQSRGVKFISDITPCCSGADSWGKIVAFYDPDGTIIELVEQPMMTIMARLAHALK